MLRERYIREDDGRIIMQRSGKNIVPGSKRPGIRAGDWVKETTDPNAKSDKTQVEKPRVLIETQRVIGAEDLTATDIALHEYLLACARQQGIQKPLHEVSVKQLLGYLEIRSITRLEASLERLSRTLIRYDVRDEANHKHHRSWVQMIRVILTEDLKSGTSTLSYEIPEVVRTAILQSRDYAWIDINLFPKFKSKYAARLYVKLALMAGQHEKMRRSWNPTPVELAKFLGYPVPEDGKIHFGSFKRAVDRAADDLENHVKRFKFLYATPERKSERGGPMDTFSFIAMSARKDMISTQAPKMDVWQAKELKRRERRVADHQIPNPLLVGRAARYIGTQMDFVSDSWRAIFRNREKDLDRDIGGMTRRQVIDMVETHGVGKAFETWIETCYGPRGTPRKEHRESEAKAREVEERNLAAAAAYVPRNQETPEQRKARRIEQAKDGARVKLELIETWRIQAPTVQSYAGDQNLEIVPAFIDELEARRRIGVYRKALSCLLERDPEDARQSVVNIYQAIADWDIDQLIKVAVGITTHDQRLSHKAGPAKPPVPATTRRAGPPPPPAPTPALAPRDADFDLPMSGRVVETSDEIPF